MDVIAMARELGKALQQEDAYIAYTLTKQNADNDPALQDGIGAFNLKKMELQKAISDPNRDQEKLSQIDSELKEIYERVMNNPSMIAYNATKGGMEKLVNYIQAIITGSANGEDPETIQEPSSCTGSCSSCGGCH